MLKLLASNRMLNFQPDISYVVTLPEKTLTAQINVSSSEIRKWL